MVFIISKTSIRNGKIRKLYYLVGNYRDRTKIKRETLLKLGECKNLSEFLEFSEKKEEEVRKHLNGTIQMFETYKTKLVAPWYMASWPQSVIYRHFQKIVVDREKELEDCMNKIRQIKSFM